MDRKEYPRCKILKKQFIKAFELKYPDQQVGTVPSPRNRFSHLSDVKDTPDYTSLASHISEDSITSAPEGHDKMYNDFTQYQEESTIHNRRFSTLGYWTPEPEHVRNSPITGKPYPEDDIKKELQELEKSAGRHTQLRRNILKENMNLIQLLSLGKTKQP